MGTPFASADRVAGMVPVILFDGICNLCNRSIDFIIKRDTEQKFRYASLQSTYASKVLESKGLDTATMRTIILIKNQRVYYRSDAVLEILRDLKFPWPVFYIFKLVPRLVRDGIYNIISNNRYGWFGKRNNCRVPTGEERALFLQDTDQP